MGAIVINTLFLVPLSGSLTCTAATLAPRDRSYMSALCSFHGRDPQRVLGFWTESLQAAKITPTPFPEWETFLETVNYVRVTVCTQYES